LSHEVLRYRAGLKYAQAVEVDPEISNQHEFNGVSALRQVLGERLLTQVPCRWFLLRDDQDPLVEEHDVTWYDSREASETRTEWRLYYTGATAVSTGDMVVVLRQDEGGDIVFVSAPQGSTWEAQLVGLFGAPPDPRGRFVVGELSTVDDAYAEVARSILDLIGWLEPVERADPSDSDRLQEKFGRRFPRSVEFSAFARELSGTDTADPDAAIMRWWKREESLFRTFEERLLGERLKKPFVNVDEFIRFSLSVQNRRKSRAGRALENHLEALFAARRVRHSRNSATEGARKPDFLFPGIAAYRDPSFDVALLTMLAVKTTCKDRWRQVTTEAARIQQKHLCTLEAAISRQQLQEMHEEHLVLVAPRPVLETYQAPSGMKNLSIAGFLGLVQERQGRGTLS
jgi:hypothetical protein